jgi:hypothetical protein
MAESSLEHRRLLLIATADALVSEIAASPALSSIKTGIFYHD